MYDLYNAWLLGFRFVKYTVNIIPDLLSGMSIQCSISWATGFTTITMPKRRCDVINRETIVVVAPCGKVLRMLDSTSIPYTKYAATALGEYINRTTEIKDKSGKKIIK